MKGKGVVSSCMSHVLEENIVNIEMFPSLNLQRFSYFSVNVQ